MEIENGVEYRGAVLNGVRSGRGTVFFEDGSSLRGMWRDDEIDGFAVYSLDEYDSIEGNMLDGQFEGHVIERQCGKVVYRGDYHASQRHGDGLVIYDDGGAVEGEFKNGRIDGKAEYIYPDGTVLGGVWSEGRMVSSVYEESQSPVYIYDESSSQAISKAPLLADPYEEKRVDVAVSTIVGAGQGLFARCHIARGEVCCFYNGVRITHSKVDRRNWSLNDNTITLDEETVLDVPKPFDKVSVYCASLGHKANHSLKHQNAKYDM